MSSPLRVESFEAYPASVAQQRLWFLDQLQGPTAAYNVHVGLWLYGALNEVALRSSLQAIVDRHEGLRTSFVLSKGALLQVVTDLRLVLTVSDLSDLADPHPTAYQIAQKEVGTPFDLSKGPLFRALLLRLKPQEHVLICTMHHTVTDSWSTQILVKELSILYDAYSRGRNPELPELPIQYGDFAEWQRGSLQSDALKKQLIYWRDTLSGAPPLLELPQDLPRPAELSLAGSTRIDVVPQGLMAAMKSLATHQQATPFMVLLAAFKTLLYRYSGQPDLLVGVPVAGRNQVETEQLIGFFVDTLVLRDDLSGNPRFLDLLAQVRETTLNAFANSEAPFEKIVEALQPERNLSYNPVFQVMFSVIKSSIRSHTFANLQAYPYSVEASTSFFDLFATFIEDSDGKWWLQLDFNTSLFKPERMARLAEDYFALLRGIAADPAAHVDELPIPSLGQNFASGKTKLASTTRQTKPRRNGSPRPKALSNSNLREHALLSEIWKDVLGLQTIGIHDNFFDVGGHSLLAARVISEIREATGRKLPVSAIFRAPTIEKLAQLIRSDGPSPPDPLLLKLHTGNPGASFFAVAAPGVDSLGLVLLARNMGDQQSVYKLQSPGPLVWGRPFRKGELQTYARDYVAAMRTVRPNGPYYLGGMCDGVLIAQQMILELESQGEEVGLFAIFDTWVIENSQIRSLWALDYYLQRLRAFPRLELAQKWATLQRVMKRWVGTTPRQKEWPQTYWPGDDFEPPRFRAPILLFKRPRQPFYYIRDPHMGWGDRTTGGVEICEIDCEHFAMLRQPHVRFIGEKLAARLTKLNQKGQAPGLTLTADVGMSVESGLSEASL